MQYDELMIAAGLNPVSCRALPSNAVLLFDDSEPRDDQGKWTDDGEGAPDTSGSAGFSEITDVGYGKKDQAKLKEYKQALNDEMDRLQGKFKSLKKIDPPTLELQNAARLKNPDGRGMAGSLGLYTEGVGQISITTKGQDHRGKSGPLRVGAFTVDGTLTGVFRHEYGHHVFQNLSNKAQDDFLGLTIDPDVNFGSVSKYAKTNFKESFAESFGMYTHRDYKKGTLPAQVEAYMEKHVGKR